MYPSRERPISAKSSGPGAGAEPTGRRAYGNDGIVVAAVPAEGRRDVYGFILVVLGVLACRIPVGTGRWSADRGVVGS